MNDDEIERAKDEIRDAFEEVRGLMTNYHHLATTNAPRTCGGCGSSATVYDHAAGFRCGACGDYPAARREPTTRQ